MRARRALCGWCSRDVCITSNDDLFYEHTYTGMLGSKTRQRCPFSGKDSNQYAMTQDSGPRKGQVLPFVQASPDYDGAIRAPYEP